MYSSMYVCVYVHVNVSMYVCLYLYAYGEKRRGERERIVIKTPSSISCNKGRIHGFIFGEERRQRDPNIWI